MSHLDVTSQTFASEVTEFKGKVLVDFWATWCGPCQMLAPIIDEIASENPGLKIVKVDVDAQVDLATRYNISSIPTVIVFDNGQPVATIIGFHQKQDYLNALK